MSLPDFREDITLPSLSSTLTETSAEASEPPVIESSLYSLIFMLAISLAMVWIAFSTASTGPTPVSEAIKSLSCIFNFTTAVGIICRPVTI